MSLALFSGCKEDKTGPVFSATPAITLKSAAPATLHAFKDTLVFTIGYTDGDGDLGNSEADSVNLFVTDTRLNLVHKFRIPQLAPTDKAVPIEGNLNIELPNLVLTQEVDQETAVFSIYLKDRAGNRSNTVQSQPITILK